jgi:site-specific recombinase XerD
MATTRLEAIAQGLEAHGYSANVIAQVISQERKRTIDESRWNKFANWCRDQGKDPFIPNQVEVTNFLASFQQELKAVTLQQYRKAIDTVWELTCDALINHDLVTRRVTQSAGNKNPSTPRYVTTYGIEPFIKYIKNIPLDANEKSARLRLLLLLRIQLLRRCSDCAYIVTKTIDLTELSFRQSRRKNQKENPHMTEPISFERNDEVPELCLKRAFEAYLHASAKHRSAREDGHLFISLTKQDEIKSETMAKICFRTMDEVGLDTKIYKSHSIRMASANAFLDNGMPVEKVMKLGDWTSTKVFEKFYLRPKATGAAKCLTDLDAQVRRGEGRTRGGRSTQRK